MPTKPKTKRSLGTHSAKRHAKHHKVSKQYLKVYWPYAPILLIVAVGLFFGTPRESQKPGVLAYATEISSTRLLDETNERRTGSGQQPLTLSESLSSAAQAKANDMAMKDYWSHYTPSGEAPWVFIDHTGYRYIKAGENLAYGFATSNDTVNGWMNSPTHKANLLDTAFTEVGFGFANASNFNNEGQETIVVAMYAKPNGSQVAAAPTSGDTNGAFTSATGVSEPKSQSVKLIHSMTAGNAPWISFAVGLASGFILLFIVIKHGFAFKRVLVHGEEFVLKHPVLDIVFVSFVMVGYVLSQTSGIIR